MSYFLRAGAEAEYIPDVSGRLPVGVSRTHLDPRTLTLQVPSSWVSGLRGRPSAGGFFGVKVCCAMALCCSLKLLPKP